MKKTAISLLALTCAIFILSGCAPASTYVPDTTTEPSGILTPTLPGNENDFINFAVHSSNFMISAGEYRYFFVTSISKLTAGYSESQLAELGLDLSENAPPLKLQHAATDQSGNRQSWYDVFRDYTLNYMKKILLINEVAAEDANSLYFNNKAETYRKSCLTELGNEAASLGVTDAQLIKQRYGSTVALSDWLSAIQKEYLYTIYSEVKRNGISSEITNAEAEEYYDGLENADEKNPAPSRQLLQVLVGSNRAKAERLVEDFMAGERTAEELTILAESRSYSVSKLENCTFKNVNDEVRDWLFTADRELYDCEIIESQLIKGHYLVMFWYGEGDPQYIIEGRIGLTNKRLDEWIASFETTFPITTDTNVLNGLNV